MLEDKVLAAMAYAVEKNAPVMFWTRKPAELVALLKELAKKSGDTLFELPMNWKNLDDVTNVAVPEPDHGLVVVLANGLPKGTHTSQAFALGLISAGTHTVVGIGDPDDRGLLGLVRVLSDRMHHVEV